MNIFILIERRFYIIGGVLQQVGDTLSSFRSYDDAAILRNEIIRFDIMAAHSAMYRDDFRDSIILTRPNGSKLELEIQESLVK